MIPVERMLSERKKWFDGSGPRADAVLSTRVRLARNVKGARFVGHAHEDELAAVYQRAAGAVRNCAPMREGALSPIDELGVLDRQFLLERHILSPDLTVEAKHRGIAVAVDEALSVMINEEDHLRLQCLASGVQLLEAWNDVSRLDDELSGEIPYAYSDELGFLTSCPTNVGTGMRASVLVHLPSLVLTQRVKNVLAGVTQVGFAVRGFHGEGSEVVGNFFQISNQVTLGVSEGTTLEKLQGVVTQVADMETRALEALLRDARVQIEDKIGRAYAMLRYARVLSSAECMGLLSAVRLGATIGLTNLPDIGTLNEILLYCQPAHIQHLAGRSMGSAERNEFRALWIQKRLNVSDVPRVPEGI